jgi:hypothetical protein
VKFPPSQSEPFEIPSTPVETFAAARQSIKTFPPKENSADRHLKSENKTIPQWALIAIPAVVALTAGYFIGREHLKYQIRSSLANVASNISKELKNGPSEVRRSGDSNATTAVEKSTSNRIPTSEKTLQFAVGESVSQNGFTITLKSARVEIPELKDILGQAAKGKEPLLILSFDIANTDDRRILRFKEDNPFMASHFKMRDDVGNVIRGVTFGIGSKPNGALTSSDDIQPGAAASHVAFFSVPPPKTQFLILSVDLACLGGEGEVEFKIPADAIVTN